jgi:hypothetical protein
MRCTAAVREAIPLPRIQKSREFGSREMDIDWVGFVDRGVNRELRRDIA